MDDFSLPDRLDPVAPIAPARRQESSSDRRRRDHDPVPSKPQDDGSDPLPDDEDLHKINEIA
jgi:hypothetical protein